MITELPAGYTARPAQMSDLEATVRMFNAWDITVTGIEEFKVDDTRREWEVPIFHLEEDTRVVVDPQGEIVAFWELWDVNEPHVKMHAWGVVHPEHAGKGIGPYLIEWAEERSRRSIPLAPPEARVVLHAYLLALDEVAQKRYHRCGFNMIRSSLRMVIDLDTPPAAPALPYGIQIRPLRPDQDVEKMVQAVRDSFRDHWGVVEIPFQDELDRYRWTMSTNPHFKPELYLLAWDGDQVAGISLCYDYFDEDPSMGWVQTLGVCRPWRKRGLGLALLQQSFVELYRRGKTRVGLGVDAESLTGATRLYIKAGMRPDPQRQFNLYEKELRPGVELATQTVDAAVAPAQGG